MMRAAAPLTSAAAGGIACLSATSTPIVAAIFAMVSTPWRLIGISIAISASLTLSLFFSARAFTSGTCHAAAVYGSDVLPLQKMNGFIWGPVAVAGHTPMPSSSTGVLVRVAAWNMGA